MRSRCLINIGRRSDRIFSELKEMANRNQGQLCICICGRKKKPTLDVATNHFK
jgi:hypothetical protein